MDNTSDQGVTRAAQCAACDVDLEPVRERESEDWFACPICGEGDTRENVVLEVQRFFRDHVADDINGQLRKIAQRSKFIKVEKTFRQVSNYRFKVDLE